MAKSHGFLFILYHLLIDMGLISLKDISTKRVKYIHIFDQLMCNLKRPYYVLSHYSYSFQTSRRYPKRSSRKVISYRVNSQCSVVPARGSQMTRRGRMFRPPALSHRALPTQTSRISDIENTSQNSEKSRQKE